MAIRPRMVRAGTLVLLASLGLQIGGIPVMAAVAPYDVFVVSSPAARDRSGALRQATDTQTASPTEADTEAELDRIAALTTLLNQQGPRSAGNLERVSSIEVVNVARSPEFVVDARAERAAADAAASEAAAIEAARSAEAAAAAQADADAAVAAALAADQANDEAETLAAQAAASATREAEAAALTATREAETAAVVATRTADKEAAASAIREAEASAAAATAMAEAQAAAAAASNREFSQRLLLLLPSLALLIGVILGLRFWRNRKEPFVLKAIPVSVTAQAHA